MQLVVPNKTVQKYGHFHRAKQAGWTDASPRVGYSKGVMSDEDYNYILGYHKPAWVRILDRLPKESKSPLVVFGKFSLPIAIELSQWDYPVMYLTNNWDETKTVMRTSEIQDGEYLRIIEQDYLKNVPHCRAIVITDLFEYFTNHEEMNEYIKMLFSRSRIVFVLTTKLINWRDVIDSCYDVSVMKYRKNYLLTIEKK